MWAKKYRKLASDQILFALLREPTLVALYHFCLRERLGIHSGQFAGWVDEMAEEAAKSGFEKLWKKGDRVKE